MDFVQDPFRQALAPRPPFWDTKPIWTKPKSLGPVPNVDAQIRALSLLNCAA